MGVWFVANSR